MNLLFITRKYPPAIGGMEKVSYALSQELAKKVPTTIIAWGGSQKWLPWFLIKSFLQSLFLIPNKRITNIHLGDGLLAPLGLVLKLLTGRKLSVTVHGLDITYKNKLYQKLVPYCLKQLDKIVCISPATLAECTKRGIPEQKCSVIPWGVYPDEFKIEAKRIELEKLVGTELSGKRVLVTVGRLVKRKGVKWFIKNVMPIIPDDYIYLVVGGGVEKGHILDVIKRLKLDKKVILMGKVTDHDLKVIYNTSDIFIMPNIPITGDIEGFGIVAIEAASTGLPVLVSDIDGLSSVVYGTNISKAIPTLDAEQWLTAVKSVPSTTIAMRKFVAKQTAAQYGWSKTTARYMKAVV